MKSKKLKTALLLIAVTITAALNLHAGRWPKHVHAYKGSTPTLDGRVAEGEYDDAYTFTGLRNWSPSFIPVTDDADLSVKWWVKHDGKNLYFAFDVTDDVLYGIDTPRWLPDENDKAHELTRQGFPWFGDGVEVLLNPTNQWPETDDFNNRGDSTSWQMVCNLTKSRLHGVGTGGLLEGEERAMTRSWNNYQKWILTGAMQAVAIPKPGGKGFIVEWMIKPDPCLEVRAGEYWNPKKDGITKMGINIGVQDLDEKYKGKGQFGNLHHENWLTGTETGRTRAKEWGTLILHPGPMPVEIHVSPAGDDKNPGTKEKPLATVSAVLDKIRNMGKDGIFKPSHEQNILVIMRGGEYKIKEPITVNAFNSGSEKHSVTFAPYPGHEWPGEKPVISSAVKLTDFKKTENNIWTLEVPEGLTPRDLYASGKRLERCRYPKEGFLHLAEVSPDQATFTFEEDLPFKNLTGDRAEIVVIEHWSVARGIIKSLNGKSVTTIHHLGWKGTPWWCNPQKHMPCFLENSPQFLEVPGTWCYDKEQNKILYLAKEGENPNKMNMTIPSVEQLMVVKGLENNPIDNTHFRGITFADTSWNIPDIGYSGLQAAHYGTGYKTEPTYAVTPAVLVERAQKSSFELCRFTRLGANGLAFGADCDNNQVLGCDFSDIGANGIMLGYRPVAETGPRKWFENDWDSPEMAPTANRVTSCRITKTGQTHFGSVGAFIAFSPDTVFEHNLIYDTPYTGLSVGFRWDTDPTTMKNCTVKNNRIFDVMNKLADGGAIYTLGLQPDTLIEDNHLYLVHRSDYAHGGAPNNGIFFDEGSKGFTVKENIIHSTSGDHYRFNQSQADWHTFEDNCIDITPNDPLFPWHRAAMAGLHPYYIDKIKTIIENN